MTGGLTSALTMLLPSFQFVPIPYVGVDEVVLREQLSASDKWLVSGPEEIQTAAMDHISNSRLRRIPFPDLYFNAFHPDQVYAWMRDGTLVEGATGPYNSAIALWAWQHGLNAHRLFPILVRSD